MTAQRASLHQGRFAGAQAFALCLLVTLPSTAAAQRNHDLIDAGRAERRPFVWQDSRLSSGVFGWERYLGHTASQAARIDRSDAHQASGVIRRGDELLIVDDESPGGFYRYPLPIDSVARLHPSSLGWVQIPHASLAVDLESIDVLCDGREVILSERLRMLVASDGWVAEYDDPLGEVGERGLEGVAVRTCVGGESHVAVVWEGGYMRTAELPAPLARRDGRMLLGNRSARPVVFTHVLAADTLGVETIADTTGRYVELQTALLPGHEPAAQRFRAPDLVWYRLQDDTWGFIALLNSSSAEPVAFEHVWLQRFDHEGQPVGDPIDLNAELPNEISELNWEGLAWYEEGKSLLLVDDISLRRPGGPPYAVIFPLPPEWRR